MLLGCLIIKKRWLNLILSGKKSLEIRGHNSHVRGIIGLIESGSGKVVATCNLFHSVPINQEQFDKLRDSHRIQVPYSELPYKHPHAWTLSDVRKLSEPVPYRHPQGAVIWVKVDNIPLNY